ncbi:hypothetical protein HBI84_214820 [Parastagonospora nodorum]|nr:hypothetical protein HBI84_214820 [Parastagonospora nodorum]
MDTATSSRSNTKFIDIEPGPHGHMLQTFDFGDQLPSHHLPWAQYRLKLDTTVQATASNTQSMHHRQSSLANPLFPTRLGYGGSPGRSFQCRNGALDHAER